MRKCFYEAVAGREKEFAQCENADIETSFRTVFKGSKDPQEPINPKKKYKCYMRIDIEWHDGTHGDPENIFGSIADALFVNDKWLASTGFDYKYADDKVGKVHVTIVI